jgi:copper resistance protein D
MIDWHDAGVEFIGFVAGFLATGAIGFRLAVLNRVIEERDFHRSAALRAAILGLIGAVGVAVLYQLGTRHTMVQGILFLTAIVGFVLVIARLAFGWWIAAIGVVFAPLSPAFFGQWIRTINPMHRLAAGFWIGTLFILVIAGLAPLLRSALTSEQRGTYAAAMINAFSPLALGSAFVLVVFGVITAWRHLKRLNSLWTTPYGYALIAKLCVVAVVVALGAWNWRRQRPLLGTESGATAIRRSATAELVAALVVVILTAILVALPTPK